MLSAVEAICKHHLEIGTDKKNTRMMAFANLTLGELFAKSESEITKNDEATFFLQRAFDLYTSNSKTLSFDEFSRLCLALSSVARK